AAMLTFALGAYAMVGDTRAAAGLAVAATAVLALREPLHGWVERLTWPELRSALVLLAMTFIALPIVPDEPLEPFGGVNPREVWVIAVVLAGVSFARYAAVKLWRPAWRPARGSGRGIGIIDRCHYRQCATGGGARRLGAPAGRRRGNGKRHDVPPGLC